MIVDFVRTMGLVRVLGYKSNKVPVKINAFAKLNVRNVGPFRA